MDGKREVIDLFLEFLLSVLIIVGGGFLVYKGIATELASGLLMLVVGFWFTKRQTTDAVNNLLRQSPVNIPVPVLQLPGPVPTIQPSVITGVTDGH